MSEIELDHIVIAAENLDQGEEYISSKLGVKPLAGGRHPHQGTHNSLLKLGKDKYLEIIAIDPEGKKPDYPRWFNLNDPVLQKQIKKEPKIITWVARTSNLTETIAQASYNPGIPRSASRGSLRWTFTFTKDGSLIQKGLLPHLIEWDSSDHPSSQLPESKVEINQMKGFHPEPPVIRGHLKSLGLQDTVIIEKSRPSDIGLEVTFKCPEGTVTLSEL